MPAGLMRVGELLGGFPARALSSGAWRRLRRLSADVAIAGFRAMACADPAKGV